MGSFYKKKKDKNVRENFKKSEVKLLLFKFLYFSNNNKNHKQFYAYEFIKKFHLNSSSSRIRNRCVYTGRSRWVLKRFKISRIKFKELVDYGILHGVRRSSY